MSKYAPKPFVYSSAYTPEWPGHVFPTTKYGRVHKQLVQQGIAKWDDFAEPRLVTREELLRAHSEAYLQKLESLLEKDEAVEIFEAPLNKATWQGVLLMTGGTIVTVENALKIGASMNLGGGFHHASRDKGGGFCLINDIAVGIESARAKNFVKRVAVIDCDLHQGNGTALIYEGNEDVFTASIHQQRLYPVKAKSSLDVGLADYAGDTLYLEGLEKIIDAVREFNPELIMYVAGADPFEGDKLGSLAVTKNGLEERDRQVYALARELDVPVAAVLAGGYAVDERDVVDIHVATAHVMMENVKS